MNDATPSGETLPFAVVILAGRASGGDRARVTEMVQTARTVGAHAIVVVVPRGWRSPPQSRVVHVAPGASAINGVRGGMAQLTNTPARHALLWPLEASSAGVDRLRTLVTEAHRQHAALSAIDGDDLDRSPVMIARDAWLDLMTLGEQGMEAVAARCGIARIAGGAT